MTSILFFLRHAAATALFVATAWAAGRALLRRWAAPPPAALAVAVGMAALAQALFLLGALGCLRRWPIVALAAAVHLLALPEWRRALARWRELRSGAPAVGLFALPLWTLSLYPPLAFDETLYHLPFTRAFAESGGLPFLTDLRLPVFPQLAEILAVPLYLFGDDVDTHAVSWLATVAVAGLLLAWGAQQDERRAGQLAAGFWLGSPIVIYLSGTGYLEPFLALLVTAAWYAWSRGARADAQDRWGWWILAGFLAGSAAGVKYHGLFFVGALGVAALVRHRWRPVLLYGAAALGALLPSYARIVLQTGNPLFPFYSDLFGVSAWTPPSEFLPPSPPAWWDIVRLPWRLVFERAAVGGLPPHSPAVLLAVPLALVGAVREPRVRLPLLLAVLYAWLVPMDARYLVLGLPLLALAAGLSAAPWLRSSARAVALCLVLPGVVYGLFSAGRRGPLPATPPARERYLENWLPLYPAVRFLNDRDAAGYTAYALGGEEMVYWARGRWLGDFVGPASFQRLPSLEAPEALHGTLRGLGAQYLVVPRGRKLGLRAGWRLPGERFALIYRDSLAEIYAVVEPAAR